ncbi:hypothetical protein OH77DRAFT_124909 [Trametes cingulata]|nr:hypothetical protein OH77DRAFT_124909 [Trametes cingulata]
MGITLALVGHLRKANRQRASCKADVGRALILTLVVTLPADTVRTATFNFRARSSLLLPHNLRPFWRVCTGTAPSPCPLRHSPSQGTQGDELW